MAHRLGAIGQTYGALLALLALVIFNVFFTRNFLTAQTLNVNLTQVSTIAIVGVGMTLVIATAGIDLSVGALMAISGALAPLIYLSKIPPLDNPWIGIPVSYIVAVLVAGLFGLFNGTLVAYFKIQPIIATLVLFIAGRGIAQVITNGQLQNFSSSAVPGFSYIGLGRPLGVPVQVIIMAVVVALTYWVVKRTVFGRFVLAVGGNEVAARLSGVPAARVKLLVYGISGLLSGIAGLIVIAINSSSDAKQVGQGMELDAITAVAVGGTLLSGGRAQVLGTLF